MTRGEGISFSLVIRRRSSWTDGATFTAPSSKAEYAEVVSAAYTTGRPFSLPTRVDTVLLAVGAPLSSVLKGSVNWRVVYDDGEAIVFRETGRS